MTETNKPQDGTEQPMSLEDIIKANTVAVEAMTAAVVAHTEALAALGGGSASKPAEKKAPAKKAPAKKAAAKKALTAEDVVGVFGPYLASGADKAEKAELIDAMRPILEHFGVKKISEVEEDQRAEAIEYGKELQAGFDNDGVDGAKAVRFDFMQDDGDDGDDGEDSPL